jgi:hypothetical protein
MRVYGISVGHLESSAIKTQQVRAPSCRLFAAATHGGGGAGGAAGGQPRHHGWWSLPDAGGSLNLDDPATSAAADGWGYMHGGPFLAQGSWPTGTAGRQRPAGAERLQPQQGKGKGLPALLPAPLPAPLLLLEARVGCWGWNSWIEQGRQLTADEEQAMIAATAQQPAGSWQWGRQAGWAGAERVKQGKGRQLRDGQRPAARRSSCPGGRAPGSRSAIEELLCRRVCHHHAAAGVIIMCGDSSSWLYVAARRGSVHAADPTRAVAVWLPSEQEEDEAVLTEKMSDVGRSYPTMRPHDAARGRALSDMCRKICDAAREPTRMWTEKSATHGRT